MNNIPKTLSQSLCALLIAGLSGCGTQYKVTRLDGPELPQQLPEAGIYYSLPKTEVVIRIPVIKKLTEHALLSYKFNDNVEKCEADENSTPDLPTNSSMVTDYKRGRIEVFTRAIPDPVHRYRLDVSSGIFSEFTHTINVTEAGILTNADTTIKDTKTAFAFSTAKSLTSLVAAYAGIPIGRPVPLKPPTCKDIIAANNKAKVLDESEEVKIQSFEVERKKLLLGSGLGSEPETLSKAISYLDEKIGEVKKQTIIKKKELEILPKKEDVSEFVLFGRFTPLEFTKFRSTPMNSRIDWSLVARVPKPEKEEDIKSLLPSYPGATAQNIFEMKAASDLKNLLDNWKLSVSLTPDITYESCTPNPCPVSEGDGYRYRLATSGELTVAVPNKSSVPEELIVARVQLPVAQYGPIARLPSKFSGLEGSIKLGLYSDFGTLKEVTVGAVPQSSTTASGYADLATSIVIANKAKRDVEAAQEAGKEKAALTDKKEILQLQFDILDLEKKIRDINATGE